MEQLKLFDNNDDQPCYRIPERGFNDWEVDSHPEVFDNTSKPLSDKDSEETDQLQVWTGNQITAENTMEEQVITTFVATVNKSHKNSATPWLEVGFVGDPADTPNGIFL